MTTLYHLDRCAHLMFCLTAPLHAVYKRRSAWPVSPAPSYVAELVCAFHNASHIPSCKRVWSHLCRPMYLLGYLAIHLLQQCSIAILL